MVPSLPVFRHRPRGKCALSMHAKSSILALGGLIDANMHFVHTVVTVASLQSGNARGGLRPGRVVHSAQVGIS